MEIYLINFLMAAILFGCCLLLNLKAGDTPTRLISHLGLMACIGLMFGSLFSAFS